MWSYYTRVGLNPMTGILIRRGKFKQTDTERRTEADVEPMHLQDEEHQGLPVTTKNWEIR